MQFKPCARRMHAVGKGERARLIPKEKCLLILFCQYFSMPFPCIHSLFLEWNSPNTRFISFTTDINYQIHHMLFYQPGEISSMSVGFGNGERKVEPKLLMMTCLISIHSNYVYLFLPIHTCKYLYIHDQHSHRFYCAYIDYRNCRVD